MGFLTTFTVRNDDCDEILKNPQEFAQEIYSACSDPSMNHKSHIFRGIVTPQRTRHADDTTIYVHAGNTVHEMCPYSKVTGDLMRENPAFFEEMLGVMERNARELRKNLKTIRKNDRDEI